ncbi:type VI secretion system protein TssA [Burkholderia glumae]
MTLETPSPATRYTDLLEPVSSDAPCGADLEYDPAFVMLQAAVAPRVEAQYGDFVELPPPANWAEIERECRALLLRTKDIRVAVILLRCRVRLEGATGLSDALAFLQSLFERYGETLHPLPMADGERDPVAYVNAIAALADHDGVLSDVRDIALPRAAGLKLHLRDVDKALATPRPKDALAPQSVVRALRELWNRRDAVLVSLADAQQRLDTLTAWCAEAFGADAPDLGALARLLQPFAPVRLNGEGSAAPDMPAAPQAAGNDARADAPPSANAAATAQPGANDGGTVGALPDDVDRWAALATLRDTRLWFERKEPSSPVIVLLRQCERMVGKRFSELVHLIPADLLAKWDAIDD